MGGMGGAQQPLPGGVDFSTLLGQAPMGAQPGFGNSNEIITTSTITNSNIIL